MLIRFFLIVASLNLISCQKDDLAGESFSKDSIYSYSPTQCAEKWQFGATNTETLTNLDVYLRDKGISVSALQISEPDGKIYCQACTCPSGRVITVKPTDANSAKKLAELGFTKN